MLMGKSSFTRFQPMPLGLGPVLFRRGELQQGPQRGATGIPWILVAAPVPLCSASHFLFCFVGCQKEVRQGDREILWSARKALELVF